MSYPGKLFFLVGPSGAGKDSLLEALKRTRYSTTQPLVAQRYITRPLQANDHQHVELSADEFECRKQSGFFLFDWSSHGYRYGIGYEIEGWLKQGHNVIVNGSRAYLPQACDIYPGLFPIWIRVTDTVMRERLQARGRESGEQIDARIRRNHELDQCIPANCAILDNNRDLATTVEQLLLLIELSTERVTSTP